MSSAGPSISVIVATRDRPDSLRACMASLAAQTLRPDEVVIVRGSEASVPPGMEHHHADLCVSVADCFQANVAMARNVGMAACGGELVCFIDDDAEAEPRWLEALARTMTADRSAWMVGGDVYDARRDPLELEFSQGVIFRTGRQRPVRRPGARHEAGGAFANVKGCNFATRRREILALGGFDEALAFAFEEADLAVRVARAGGRVVHQPAARVLHFHAPGLFRGQGRFDRDWKAEFRSHTTFCLKHAGARGYLAGRLVVALRRVKLVAMVAKALLFGQIPLRRAYPVIQAANAGVREARRAFRAR